MLFYASAASLETKIYSDNLTLKYNISGYSEKAPLLLNSILNEIKDIKITKEEFDLYSTSLKSSYLNIGQAIPILQANEIMQNILSNVSPKHNEQVAALNNVSYEDFLIFCSNLFIKSYIEVLLIGNIDEKEASQVWETVQKELNHNSYPTSEHIKKRMLVLPPSKGPYKICEKTSSLGNAVILAIHEGPFSYQNKASATVLGLALQEDFFDTLRTKQQTGYITRAFTQEEQKQLYQYFLVQSTTHHPEELIARFELFLETYSKDFESMIEEGRFEMIRNSLISDLNTPPTNLTEMARLLNSLAFTYEGDFQRIEKFTTALKSLTYEKLKVDAIKFLSRKNNKRVAVLLEGNQPEEKSFCYEEVNAASIKKEGSYISSP